MVIGVVGMGLIGGSVCKSYRKNLPESVIYGYDLDSRLPGIAELAGVINGELTQARLKDCDVVFLAAYPEATKEYLSENALYFNKNGIVLDCCGIKSAICAHGFALAKEHGFTFVGGHPMAGSHHSGYKYATATLFDGAPMVLVPEKRDDIDFYQRLKTLLAPLRFGRLSVTTAEEHDRIIAFTSQMAHVVSNAYVKSPTAEDHKGFSAGSYKDLTRVAWLSAPMWSELFIENKEALLYELRLFKENIEEYIDAIERSDNDKLCRILQDGSDIKGRIDGK